MEFFILENVYGMVVMVCRGARLAKFVSYYKHAVLNRLWEERAIMVKRSLLTMMFPSSMGQRMISGSLVRTFLVDNAAVWQGLKSATQRKNKETHHRTPESKARCTYAFFCRGWGQNCMEVYGTMHRQWRQRDDTQTHMRTHSDRRKWATLHRNA